MKKIAAALLISASVLLAACSASDSSDKNKASDEIQKKLDSILSSDGELLTGELENKTIKFLSTWDINPDDTGKSVPLELALFQQKYGGNIKTKIVSWSERYEQLAYSINGGEGIDFFPANDFDAFPKGAIKDMFVPVDDYIDYSSPLWTDVKEANDRFMWDGKHYMICTDVTSDCIMIYNRTVMNEMGFEDPAKLYAEGKWTWDTLKDMLSKFCDENESRYGIDGWYFEAGISKTTGVPYIGLENGRIVNNMRNSDIERVQNYMYDLNKSGYILDKSKFEWTEHPEFIASGKELFYPCGMWKLYCEKSQWSSLFGDDAFFVPMPKDPEADEYYTPSGINGYLMVKGGQNPEGVAKFTECKRFSVVNQQVADIAEEQFRNDYGWTDEMMDMKKEAERLSSENPVFDFYAGISSDITLLLDSAKYGIRAAMAGTPWSETVDSVYDTVNQLIDDATAE